MRVKFLVCIAVLFFLVSSIFGEFSHIAVIDDPDGFVNIRHGKSTETQLIGQNNDGERFQVEPSTESWWRVSAADGTEGYVHKSRIRLLSEVANSSPNGSRQAALAQPQAPATDSSPSTPWTIPSHFSPGFPVPGPKSSDTEMFLYELHRITMSYFLASSYQKAYGNDVYTDAYWALGRGIAVQEMVDATGDEIPPSIVKFCTEALQLDCILQVIASISQNSGESVVDDAQKLFIESVGGYSRQQDSSESLSSLLTKAVLRAGTFNAMARNLLETKQNGEYHRRWANLLDELAEGDASLRPYAAAPHFTDTTWHFLRASEQGDTYRGETVASRGPNRVSVSNPERRIHLGSLDDGPILVKIDKNGSFIYEMTVDTPQGTGPILQAECSRGHFGYQMDNISTWAARGLTDFNLGGRIDRSAPKYGDQGGLKSIHLYHLATGAEGEEDAISEGTLLIYRQGQGNSDEDAKRLARVVNL